MLQWCLLLHSTKFTCCIFVSKYTAQMFLGGRSFGNSGFEGGPRYDGFN